MSKKNEMLIRKDIERKIKKQRCVVLGISTNIVVDRKDGKGRDLPLKNQKVSDFQPLLKDIYEIKKEHCRNCNESGKRFDARCMGFTCGWVAGDENTSSCPGCFWYDPIAFRRSFK